MKLQKGDKITEINLPSIDGKNFSFNKIKLHFIQNIDFTFAYRTYNSLKL